MAQRIADSLGGSLTPQERILQGKIIARQERLNQIQADPRAEGEARRLRGELRGLRTDLERSLARQEGRSARTSRATTAQLIEAGVAPTPVPENTEPLGPIRELTDEELLEIGLDSAPVGALGSLRVLSPSQTQLKDLLDAEGKWKTDQEVLFDNMTDGINLIKSSLTPAEFHYQSFADPDDVAGKFDRSFIKDSSVKSLYGTDNFIPQDRKPYKNFVKIANENSLTFISELTKNPGIYGFLNIPTPILSFLVPKIRIYKARYLKENQKDPLLIEFVFEDSFNKNDIEAIMNSSRNRGSGAGITSFTWDLLGTNPFDADKLIDAQLNLHFQSIQDFSINRESPTVKQGNKLITDAEERRYKYSELVVPSTKFIKDPKDPSEETYDERYYQIMVDVGWAIPQNIDDNEIWNIITRYNRSSEQQLKITPLDIRNTIRNLNMQMFLTSPRHQISYNQDGTVDISVDYAAYVNRVMGNPKVDLFRLSDQYNEFMRRAAKDQEQNTQLAEKFKNIDKQKEKDNSLPPKLKAEKDRLAKQRKQQKEEFKGSKIIFYNSVVQKLLKEQVIYNIDYVWENDKAVLKTATGGKNIFPTITLPGSFCQDSIDKNIEKQVADNKTRTSNSIYYFFLGDLLDVLYELLYNIAGVTSFSEIRPLVGSFEYYDKSNNRIAINLADIPISLNYFNLFLKREFVDAGVDRYILDRFLQKLLGSFLFPLINSSKAEGMANTQRFTVSANLVNGPAGSQDPINDKFQEGDTQYSGIVRKIKEVPTADAALAKNEIAVPFTYFILYASSSGSRLFREGNYIRAEIRDKNRGIYWIRAGQDVGALKEVNFERNDIPFYREYLISRPGSPRTSNNEGNLDDIKFLKEKYNAQLSFFGIPNIIPGQYIYVEPVSFGLSEPNPENITTQQLGYSGYYIVIQVQHSIERGMYETRINARWESSGIKQIENSLRGGES